MKAVAILNLAAGTDYGREEVAAALQQAGIRAQVQCVQRGELAAAVVAAMAAPLDAVIIGGGDGTLSAAAAVLAGRNLPLGVLPAGTFNHFAKDLGIPLALADAANVVACGRVKAVDLGEVNGHVFLNNSSLGIYPPTVWERERQQSELGRSKWRAMLSAMINVFRRFPTLEVRVDAGGPPRVLRTAFMFIGNNLYETRGWSIGRRQRLDGGQLCLYLTSGSDRWTLFRLAVRAAIGRLEDDVAFESLSLPEFRIDSRRRYLPVATDGEVMLMRPPLQYRVRPAALRVLAPS